MGASAAKIFCDMEVACNAMAGKAKVVLPNAELKEYHEKKYKVFLQMIQNQKEYDKIMAF